MEEKNENTEHTENKQEENRSKVGDSSEVKQPDIFHINDDENVPITESHNIPTYDTTKKLDPEYTGKIDDALYNQLEKTSRKYYVPLETMRKQPNNKQAIGDVAMLDFMQQGLFRETYEQHYEYKQRHPLERSDSETRTETEAEARELSKLEEELEDMCWTIEQLPKNSTNKYEIFKLWFETDNIDMPLN